MSESLVQIGQAMPTTSRGDRKGRPEWLRIKLVTSSSYHQVRNLVESLNLHTVCQEARCPNIYECWGEHGTATFMILGDVCTRRCGFCAVTSGRPQPGVDPLEPEHVAEAVAAMGLRHAVVTSVDRDDLPDGGAGHFAQVIAAVHRRSARPLAGPTAGGPRWTAGIPRRALPVGRLPGCAVEVLTPDFRGVSGALDVVLGAAPEVFSHNMETVPRLYRQARPGSRYDRSLGLLAAAAGAAAAGGYGGRIKTGIMVGLGEEREEVLATLADIRGAGVEILTIGQYLQPTAKHLPVARWVHPDEFAAYRDHALRLGFAHCEAGPLVRSSYHAHEHVRPAAAGDR